MVSKSGSTGKSHSHAPTDQYVTVFRHTVPATLSLETSRPKAEAEKNRTPPLEFLPQHQGDRFPRSIQKSESRSCYPYAGRRPDSMQVASELVLES